MNFGNKDVDITWNSEHHKINVLIIDNINVQDLSELRDVKKYKNYTIDQLQRMIDCFNEQQNQLGVYQLLLASMNLYLTDVQRLITSYSNGR